MDKFGQAGHDIHSAFGCAQFACTFGSIGTRPFVHTGRVISH